jgi:cardiolipin synthase
MNTYQKPFETAIGETFRAGNQVEVLQNGNEIFPAMLASIRSAQTSIEFATYVYWHSDIATDFAVALCERARAGVKVRLLIDAVGGAIMSTRTFWELERAGVKVAWFRPLRMGSLRRINHRSHRKILIIDGHTGFTGGVGIADQWNGLPDGGRYWRETHCRVAGPVCADLHASFAGNWIEAAGERLAAPATAPRAGSTPILTTSSVAGTHPTAMEQLFATAIATARERLWITTAYFVPTPEFVALLAAAAARGVDVRILTNGSRTNHKLTRRAGQGSYEALMEQGVKIYEYQRSMIHVKLITIDRQWATIGSANFDNRSLVLNDELNISLINPKIVAELDAQFWRDISGSQHISFATWHRRPWYMRMITAGSQVFSKQL